MGDLRTPRLNMKLKNGRIQETRPNMGDHQKSPKLPLDLTVIMYSFNVKFVKESFCHTNDDNNILHYIDGVGVKSSFSILHCFS